MANKFNKWLKKQMAAIIIATANVEKSSLGQKTKEVETGGGQYQRLNQGTLADSLINAEVTEEVKNLRWRMYKILDATDGVDAKITGYEEDGTPIVETMNKTSDKTLLEKVKMDEYDDYPLEIMVSNKEITLDTADGMDLQHLEDDTIEIEFDLYTSSIKAEKPIQILREYKPKFEIEKYAKKLNIRKIDEKSKLLEFYISKYPDEYDRKTYLLISEIKRAMKNPRGSDMLDITDVIFISHKTLGVKDFLEFRYKINSFDKIVEYDGHYVIKFIGDVTVDGDYLLEKYRLSDLDEKYENKERKQ